MPIESTVGTFYHLPKAAGTYITQLLIEHYGGKHVGPRGGHIPCWAFPSQVQPAFGVRREPFSWYQSLYAYAIKGKGENLIAPWGRAYSDDWFTSISFKAMVYGMTHPWEVPEFHPVVGIIYQPQEYERAIQELRSGQIGFASWVAYDMFERGEPDVHVMNQATLNQELEAFLGGPVPTLRKDATNSARGPKAQYDGDMKGWVETADSRLIELTQSH